MAYLNYIMDCDLEAEVKHLLTTARQAKEKTSSKFDRNVIDPFAALFEMAGFRLSHEQWYENELIRQSQKTLQNQVGEFHQKVLGHVQGWEDLGKGNIVDLVSHQAQIIAEVKNKYNTVSGGKLAELYDSLDKLVMPKSSKYKDYTVYYVTVIPKKAGRFDVPFTPSDKDKGARCRTNPLIRKIDGASFYTLVTGEEDALANLYTVMPQVIASLSTKDFFQPQDIQHLQNYFRAAFGSMV